MGVEALKEQVLFIAEVEALRGWGHTGKISARKAEGRNPSVSPHGTLNRISLDTTQSLHIRENILRFEINHAERLSSKDPMIGNGSDS